MQTRRANYSDLLEMQHCNLRCLPENYNLRYYLYHYLSWPELLHVSHDYNGNVCGYVLAKLDDEEEDAKCHGHITSLAVLRTQRKLGIASKVMKQSLDEMEEMTAANFCSLHVRRTNEAALHLYQNSLGFRCAEVDVGYYVDGEDAFHMKKYLNGAPQQGSIVNKDGTLTKLPPPPPGAYANMKKKATATTGTSTHSGCKDANCKTDHSKQQGNAAKGNAANNNKNAAAAAPAADAPAAASKPKKAKAGGADFIAAAKNAAAAAAAIEAETKGGKGKGKK